MPIYNFNCPHCGHYENDKMVKSMDEKVKCPMCNKEMNRVQFPTSFGFKIDPAV